MIKAERGASFRSDIAVDDVSFAPECLQIQGWLFVYRTATHIFVLLSKLCCPKLPLVIVITHLPVNYESGVE